MGVQALTIDDEQSDDESSEDEESISKSPVSYLRVVNKHKFGKSFKSSQNDIIEPDPDAR